jgi:hypothetical protein
MACSQIANGEDSLHVWRVAMAITMLNKPAGKPWYTYSGFGGGSVAKKNAKQNKNYLLKKSITTLGNAYRPSGFIDVVFEHTDVHNRKEVKLNLHLFEDDVSRHLRFIYLDFIHRFNILYKNCNVSKVGSISAISWRRYEDIHTFLDTYVKLLSNRGPGYKS